MDEKPYMNGVSAAHVSHLHFGNCIHISLTTEARVIKVCIRVVYVRC